MDSPRCQRYIRMSAPSTCFARPGPVWASVTSATAQVPHPHGMALPSAWG